MMQPVFRTIEQLHYSDIKGTIDVNVYSGLEQQYVSLMQLLGNQQYWATRRSWFGERFQEYTDKMIVEGQTVEPANFELEECE